MRPFQLAVLGLPFAVAACVASTTTPALPPQVIVAPQPAVAAAAPTVPPPPEAELVPPRPASSVPVTWQPGHWSYTGMAGAPWRWQQGQYVAVPTGYHTWVPGQWTPDGGNFIWQDGHWA